MHESILICGNCGFVGRPSDFGGDDGDYVPCMCCGVDQTAQLTARNFDNLVDKSRPDYADIKARVDAYEVEFQVWVASLDKMFAKVT